MVKVKLFTILGTAGIRRNKEDGKEELALATYWSPSGILGFPTEMENGIEAPNTLFLFWGNPNVEVYPFYTQRAKNFQQRVLEKFSDEKGWTPPEKFEDLIARGREVEEEDLASILREFRSLLKSVTGEEEQEKVIVDITHGFRYMPLMLSIGLVLESFNENPKIGDILLAKEIEQWKKYQLISIREYFDYLQMTLLIGLFHSNYTIARNIPVPPPFKKLQQAMEEFVDNLTGMALQQLPTSAKKIIAQLEEIETGELGTLFKSEGKKLKKHLREVYIPFTSPLDYYFKVGEELLRRGHFSQALGILNELLYFEVRELFRECGGEVAQFILNYENLIERGRKGELELKKNEKLPNDYYLNHQLLGQPFKDGGKDECPKIPGKNSKSKLRRFYWLAISKFKPGAPRNGVIIKQFNQKLQECCEQKIENFKREELEKLISIVTPLRNNLLHGNSGIPIGNVKAEVEEVYKKYREFRKKYHPELEAPPAPSNRSDQTAERKKGD
ncbi:MAG: TM1812 family CRISPR-associated protein [Campylobacterales bacterium]